MILLVVWHFCMRTKFIIGDKRIFFLINKSNGLTDYLIRDLKPENLLVYSDKLESEVNLKLADFGTSRYFSAKSVSMESKIFEEAKMKPTINGVTSGLGTVQYTGII